MSKDRYISNLDIIRYYKAGKLYYSGKQCIVYESGLSNTFFISNSPEYVQYIIDEYKQKDRL